MRVALTRLAALAAAYPSRYAAVRFVGLESPGVRRGHTTVEHVR